MLGSATARAAGYAAAGGGRPRSSERKRHPQRHARLSDVRQQHVYHTEHVYTTWHTVLHQRGIPYLDVPVHGPVLLGMKILRLRSISFCVAMTLYDLSAAHGRAIRRSRYRGGKVLQLPLHNGSSHSPPLIVTGCGRRPGGGDAGCRSVVMRRSFDGGKSFDEPRVVANASHLVWDGTIPDGIYDGAFVHDSRTNTTLMHWGMCIEQCRPGRNQSVWRAPSYMQTRSTDGFVTWTTRNLTAEVGEAANHLYPDNYYGNGLQLHDGTLVLCGSQMDFDNPAPEQKPGATDGGFCVRSTDGGRSFARGETFAHDWPPCKSTGCAKMQMQVGQFANGTLLVMGGAGQPSEHDTFAISTDGGVTFSSPHSDPRLPTSTESDLLVVTKKGGDAIFVSHDFCPGCSPLPDGHNRRNLTISASYNHGVTWHHVPLLPEDGREDFSGGSCMADMSVGGYDSIAVGYERGSKRFDGELCCMCSSI